MLRFRRVPRSELLAGLTPAWWVATTLFIATILFAFWSSRNQGPKIVVCPMQLVAGLPCPLCGGTTATFHLASGQIVSAWKANPLVTILIPLAALWLAAWMVLGIKVETTLPSLVVAGLILLLFALNWAWILLR